MRITSNTYSNILMSSSQSLQQEQETLQQEIASGNSVTDPSDSPVAYSEAAQAEVSMSQLNNYNGAVNQATTMLTQANQAMVSIHSTVAQASELATGVNGTMSTSDMQDVGTEMSSLLDQLTNVVNQKDPEGNYMFGGTSNQEPLDPTTQTYNAATNNQGQTINVQSNLTVQTGVLAGRPGVNGFLYNSSSGVDLIATLKQTISDLNAGNANAVQTTDLPALNNGLDHISQFVGSTAADLQAATSSGQMIQQQLLNKQQQVSGLTQINVATTLVQLQQTQLAYQASLQAGSKILGLSLLNYFGSIPNS